MPFVFEYEIIPGDNDRNVPVRLEYIVLDFDEFEPGQWAQVERSKCVGSDDLMRFHV